MTEKTMEEKRKELADMVADRAIQSWSENFDIICKSEEDEDRLLKMIGRYTKNKYTTKEEA